MYCVVLCFWFCVYWVLCSLVLCVLCVLGIGYCVYWVLGIWYWVLGGIGWYCVFSVTPKDYPVAQDKSLSLRIQIRQGLSLGLRGYIRTHYQVIVNKV